MGDRNFFEVRHMVAKFLNPQDLTICARVCRAWNVAFSPLLWTELQLCQCQGHPLKQSLLSIQENASFVRELILCGCLSSALMAAILTAVQPTMELASFRIKMSKGWPVDLVFLAGQIRTLARRVKSLELEDFEPLLMTMFWAVLEGGRDCLAMTKLRLVNTQLSLGGNEGSFWNELCDRLESLELKDVTFGEAPGWMKRDGEADEGDVRPYSRMRFLKIQYKTDAGSFMSWMLEHLLWRCPKLHYLSWVGPPQMMQPYLGWRAMADRVEIRSPGNEKSDLDEEIMSRILVKANCKPLLLGLLSFKVPGSTFGKDTPGAFGSLVQHFLTLQELDIRSTPTSSIMIQKILSSCPNLVVFSADVILARDIDQDRPWVCIRLKSLTLYFDTANIPSDDVPPISDVQVTRIIPVDYALRERALAQLGQLIQLVHLDLRDPRPYDPAGPMFSPSGAFFWQRWWWMPGSPALENIKDLTRLKRIVFPRCPSGIMDEQDVQWMRDQWTTLEEVTFQGTSPPKVAESLFRSRGIRCLTC